MKAKKVYENVFKPKILEGIEKEGYEIVRQLESMGFRCSARHYHGVFLINFSTQYWKYNCDVAFVDKESTSESMQKEFYILNQWYANLSTGSPFTAESWQKLVSMIADKIFNLGSNDLDRLIQDNQTRITELKEKLESEEREREYLKNAQRIINEG